MCCNSLYRLGSAVIIKPSDKQMKTPDMGYCITIHSLFVAKPVLGAMTPLDSLFQVMVKESTQVGDL